MPTVPEITSARRGEKAIRLALEGLESGSPRVLVAGMGNYRDAYDKELKESVLQHHVVKEVSPNSSVHVLDRNPEFIEWGGENAEYKGLKNVEFLAHELSRYVSDPKTPKFNAVITTNILYHQQSEKVVREIARNLDRLLHSGGRIVSNHHEDERLTGRQKKLEKTVFDFLSKKGYGCERAGRYCVYSKP
jgi:16S rRNA G1207 methylase RsmC